MAWFTLSSLSPAHSLWFMVFLFPVALLRAARRAIVRFFSCASCTRIAHARALRACSARIAQDHWITLLRNSAGAFGFAPLFRQHLGSALTHARRAPRQKCSFFFRSRGSNAHCLHTWFFFYHCSLVPSVLVHLHVLVHFGFSSIPFSWIFHFLHSHFLLSTLLLLFPALPACCFCFSHTVFVWFFLLLRFANCTFYFRFWFPVGLPFTPATGFSHLFLRFRFAVRSVWFGSVPRLQFSSTYFYARFSFSSFPYTFAFPIRSPHTLHTLILVCYGFWFFFVRLVCGLVSFVCFCFLRLFIFSSTVCFVWFRFVWFLTYVPRSFCGLFGSVRFTTVFTRTYFPFCLPTRSLSILLRAVHAFCLPCRLPAAAHATHLAFLCAHYLLPVLLHLCSRFSRFTAFSFSLFFFSSCVGSLVLVLFTHLFHFLVWFLDWFGSRFSTTPAVFAFSFHWFFFFFVHAVHTCVF